MIKKNLIAKLITGCFITFILTINCFAVIVSNGVGIGYEGSGESSGEKNTAIENYITEGAFYFLNANSDIQEMLTLVEFKDVQGIDFNRFQDLLDSAIFNMSKARETYYNLIKKAEVTPYNERVTALLRDFDYTAFRLENNLNADVFKRAAEYLKQGDITAVFKSTYSEFLGTAKMLDLIKGEAIQAKLPGTAVFWELNEKLAQISLFGSFVARIFAGVS